MRLKKILKKFVAETLSIVIALGVFTIIPVSAEGCNTTVDSKLSTKGVPTIGGGTDYFVNQPITLSGIIELTLDKCSPRSSDYGVHLDLRAFEGTNTEGESVTLERGNWYVDYEFYKLHLGVMDAYGTGKLPEYMPKSAGDVIFKLSGYFKEEYHGFISGSFNDVEVSDPINVKNYVTSLEPDVNNPISTTVNTDTSFKFTVTEGLAALKNKDTGAPQAKIALYNGKGKKLSNEQNFALGSNNNLTATVYCNFSEIGTYTLIPKIQDNYEGATLYSFDGFNIDVKDIA